MDSQPTRPERREPLGETITRVNIHKPIIHKPVDPASKRQSVDLHAALPPIPSQGEENDAYPYNVNRNSHIQPVSDEPPASSKRFSQISTTSNTSSASRRKTHVGPWRLGRTLGRGASGRVRLAKHSQTGQYAAVKIVAKNTAALVQSKSMAFAAEVLEGDSKDKRLPLGIEREVVIMKLIDHPNVMRLYDVWENRGELYIVLEYIEGGELFTYLSQRGRLPENEAVHYFRQIISGLSYCHKFGICHRDLKPENLLLDASQSTIKIADFGMAALQPRGAMLHTSCGSPHYAAPEIIRGQPYRGEKCDIWSCGIILFALLAGYLPFDHEDIRILLRKVKIGKFEMPEPFSMAAKDLIYRMLEQDPNQRITMDEIWEHPLLKQYENTAPIINGHQPSTGNWTGTESHLGVDNVGRPVKKRSEIDSEILRNLQTLWYGEKKEDIVQRLLSNEESDEKVFYHLLARFKESQQENYHSTDITYSSSDKHHRRRTSIPVEPLPSLPVAKIPVPVELPRKLAPAREDSGLSTAETVLSYDAFRMSGGLDDMPEESAKLALIEALRDTATIAPRLPSHSTTFRSANRLRTRHQLDSCVSVASSVRSTRSAKRRIGTKKIGSKASFSSSMHKTGSTMNQLSEVSRSGVPKTPSKPRSLASRSTHNVKKTPRFVLQNKSNATSSSLSKALAGVLRHSSSPPLEAIPLPVPRRPSTAHSQKTKSRVSYMLSEEARKVSAELEALCEEMFNRSSGVSTVLTGADSNLPKITPSSSISSLSDSFFTAETVIKTADAIQMQEVIPVPPGTAIGPENAFAHDVRVRIVNRAREPATATRSRGSSFNSGFRNVIARLDSLTQMPAHGRRAISSPLDHRIIASGTRPLPVISEEKPSMDGYDPMNRGNRISSEPGNRRYSLFPPADSKDRAYRPAQPTRLVDIRPPSITHVPPPLRVRKRPQTAAEEQYPLAGPSSGQQYQQRQLPRPPIAEMTPPEIPQRRSFHPLESNPVYPRRSMGSSPNPSMPSTPSPLHQSHASYQQSEEDVWRRDSSSSDAISPSEFAAPAPPPKDGKRLPPLAQGRKMPERKEELVSFQDMAPQQPKRLSGVSEKWSLLKRFAKQATSRVKGDEDTGDIALDTQSCHSRTSSDATASVRDGWMPPRISNDYQGHSSRLYAAPEQHWLARLFHIKPAVRTVCLEIGQKRARRELTKALRSWRKYGMLDVIEDREAGIISGRVGEQNFLSIKPVSFRIELFGVTEVGKGKNKVCIARVTQVAGAASSMNKVVTTLETVLRSRGFLVKEKKRIRAMERLLK